ncbi:MAG: response regulator transcription factor [Alphaproteobacteria bacterium]|nr:response regulator transcription factor [Alphaproteobacteria bacterium]
MKLLLADDHTLFRDALMLYIERAEPQSTVTLAEDLHQALKRLAEDSRQDLVLLDLRMPGMKGMDGLRQVKEKYPHIPIALMSGVAEKRDVEEALEIGAVGYFPKTLSGKALLQAIQKVVAGEKFVPMDEAEKTVMPSYYADKNTTNLDAQLTPREAEVLSFLARGASNKEIATELDLQVVTVKLHVRGICKKLDAKNRTQAALKARELGLAVAQ